MGKRIYPLQRIKSWLCYDLDDICALYKKQRLHPQTVRAWIKQGLPIIDNRKPVLVYGDALKIFLGRQNLSSKSVTAFTEMFCFKCREARPAYQRQIILEQTGNYVKAKALCRTCKSTMNKSYRLADIPQLKSAFRLGDVLELYDCSDSPVNTHFVEPVKQPTIEPEQWELF